jgi:undecaprenyl phosphate-alpha-L-ara4FN deformylase
VPPVLGLRIDVDTYIGALRGLPHLLERLARDGLRTSLFIPGGPDRTGLAAKRILTQRGYLRKLLRTGAFRIYGPSALAAGLLHRGRAISQSGEALMRARLDGHEFVAHGFTHTVWHNDLHRLDPRTVQRHVRLSVEALEAATGSRPVGFGGPGWQANFASLHALDELGLTLGGDTRGSAPFLPVLHGYRFKTPQVPTTLPSLDEFARGLPPARADVHALFDSILAQEHPVYAAHAELEGRFFRDFFDELLTFCWREGVGVVPVSEVLSRARQKALPTCRIEQASVPNRPGLVAIQGAPL